MALSLLDFVGVGDVGNRIDFTRREADFQPVHSHHHPHILYRRGAEYRPGQLITNPPLSRQPNVLPASDLKPMPSTLCCTPSYLTDMNLPPMYPAKASVTAVRLKPHCG